MQSFLSRATVRPTRRLTTAMAAFALAGTALSACNSKKAEAPRVGTEAVERRTIVVDAQATGAVEPINIIEVKSKASGQITKMPVETGAQVKAGDLLVQVDTRDVRNQYDQALADARSARASLEAAASQKKRSDELYKTRIITAQEYEAAQLAYTQAQGGVVRANTNLDLAKQRLEDATVVAPVAGTIIEKPVALGQVIASATGSVSGGTTLLKMADLSKVRVRALVNETDIGNVRAGQPARVTVDAYPERPFQGVVEKIEPQAVVVQSVTMFPVIVSLENNEGFLKPGMNGEVSLLIDRRENVLTVSNDAVKNVREAATAAALVGLDPDSVTAMVRAAQAGMRGGAPGGGAGQPAGDTPSTVAVPGEGASTGGNAGGNAGNRSASAGAGRARGESAGAVAGGRGAGQGGNGAAGRGGNGAAGAATMGAGMAGGRPVTSRARTALVFVEASAGKFEPRIVRLGASNYDYSEVVSGLKEGENVALLSVASLQQRREAQNDRMRQNSNPLGITRPGGAGAAPAGGGGGGGGGRPPGGGR